MTKDTLDYKQLMESELSSDFKNEQNKPEYSDLSETLSTLPVESDDEQALEQYMNNMLERLTGSKRPEPAVTQPFQPIDAVVPATPAVPAPPPREPVRPSAVKEDLNGMRALANQNVESALGVHSYGQLEQRTKAALVASVGLSLSSSLLILYTHSANLSWSYPAAIAGMAGAFLASFRYFGLARRLAKIHRQLSLRAE